VRDERERSGAIRPETSKKGKGLALPAQAVQLSQGKETISSNKRDLEGRDRKGVAPWKKDSEKETEGPISRKKLVKPISEKS